MKTTLKVLYLQAWNSKKLDYGKNKQKYSAHQSTKQNLSYPISPDSPFL